MIVYVLRTDNSVVGVFVDKEAAVAHGKHFTMTHSQLFPEQPARKCYVDEQVLLQEAQ